MAELQLALVGPGLCRGEGCNCRLSVADLGGLCCNCEYALQQATKQKAAPRGVNGQKLPPHTVTRRTNQYSPREANPRCAICGQPRAFKSRRKCNDCHNAENRASRARRSAHHHNGLKAAQAGR